MENLPERIRPQMNSTRTREETREVGRLTMKVYAPPDLGRILILRSDQTPLRKVLEKKVSREMPASNKAVPRFIKNRLTRAILVRMGKLK